MRAVVAPALAAAGLAALLASARGGGGPDVQRASDVVPLVAEGSAQRTPGGSGDAPARPLRHTRAMRGLFVLGLLVGLVALLATGRGGGPAAVAVPVEQSWTIVVAAAPESTRRVECVPVPPSASALKLLRTMPVPASTRWTQYVFTWRRHGSSETILVHDGVGYAAVECPLTP